MEAMNVPQRKVAARLHLADGQDLEGLFFVPATGPDGAPGRLLDQLNRQAERFLPFAVDDATVLVHKERIVSIELGPADQQHEAPVSEFGHRRRIGVSLVARGAVAGWLHYVMPLDQERLRDYLNTVTGFLALHAGDKLVLINPHFIASVSELGEG